MMRYEVVLFAERGIDKRQVTDAAQWFVRCSGPVSVRATTQQVPLTPNDDGLLSREGVFETIRQLRDSGQIADSSFVCLLTKTPDEDNWFSDEDPQQKRNGFGHVGEYNWVTSAPTSVIAVHYVLKGLFNALITEADIQTGAVWHDEPRGCFFDFCERKCELSLKLRTADICGDCMETLRSIGVADALLRQTVEILEASRHLAVNTGQYLTEPPIFSEWPFPVAITRHKAIQATRPLLRFQRLLDHFDSLVRYFYLAHEVLRGCEPARVEKPSLGWWVDQLAQALKGEASFRKVIAIAQQEKIVALRNERRGHGYMATSEDSYRDAAIKLEQVLGDIEEELKPFFDAYQLVIPRESRIEGGATVVMGDHLVGSHVLHPPFKVVLEGRPDGVGLQNLDEVYLSDTDLQRFWRMDPYLVSKECPTCRDRRILIIDGTNQYIDTQAGHRVSLV